MINSNDPSEMIYQCEVDDCNNRFARKHGFSFVVCYATPGLDVAGDGSLIHHAGYMCEGSSGGSGQHWACSHEHAVQLAHQCIDEHIAHESNNHRWSQTPTLV